MHKAILITMITKSTYYLFSVNLPPTKTPTKNNVKNKIAVTKRQIIGVVVDNVPGSFNKLLLTLSSSKINIEDCYGFLLSNGTTAAIVLEIENYPDTAKLLCDKGFDVLSSDKIYKY